ncbi:WecB/TagA/CpsF family glycosyl transferase (modular protein) [uncultured Mycobacterium sp.]|uniref:WecB/TagA/CpsF family glycosyl transferase (Modular protein) n=1 Tax=uncultured Mycobacterium sp. TaxID=171292 RepID=A0A1Y5PEG6_9MYCO|nr:WecB/TagA/CpsF family glycosyl transferase (modular protein) [uncultured Mycobacterium sp.]
MCGSRDAAPRASRENVANASKIHRRREAYRRAILLPSPEPQAHQSPTPPRTSGTQINWKLDRPCRRSARYLESLEMGRNLYARATGFAEIRSTRSGDMKTSPKSTSRRTEAARTEVGGIVFDNLTEDDVVGTVRRAWTAGEGGSIIPVNVDVARAADRSAEFAEVIARGSLVIADGMPLVWAARLKGKRLPERVAGSSLVFSLSNAAADAGKTVYLFGGAVGVPEQAVDALAARFAKLRIAGTLSPEFGFDKTEEGLRQAVSAVVTAAPDLVFVGLGFPRQELFIEQLRQELPNTWFLACGGGIAMAAGVVRRASPVMQRLGFEWVHRLALEPRRLARRYLRDDLPFALKLLAQAAIDRFR